MAHSRSSLFRVGMFVPLAVLAGCADENAPGISLRVTGSQVDPATFPVTGELTLGLVVSNPDGSLIPRDSLVLVAELQDGTEIQLLSLTREPPETRPVAVAISIDNSKSMRDSDSDNRRRSASQIFWETVTQQRPGNEVSLLDFSGRPPTPGFRFTRLLHDWTTDRNSLATKLVEIVPDTVSGTPLFRSLLDATAWIDTSTSATFKRVMLVLTDGLPTGRDSLFANSAISSARARGIVVHTVGLGAASATDSDSDPRAVAITRSIAEGTGGLYAGVATADGLEAVFRTFAEVSIEGPLFAVFRLNSVPPSGNVIPLVLIATKGRQTTSTEYSFVVP